MKSNPMIGTYVLVRCRDAGVHAGILEYQKGREAVLLQDRRLWYWKPKNGSAFLSGVAVYGLDLLSRVGVPVERIHLTETCEIMAVSQDAIASISGAKAYAP